MLTCRNEHNAWHVYVGSRLISWGRTESEAWQRAEAVFGEWRAYAASLLAEARKREDKR